MTTPSVPDLPVVDATLLDEHGERSRDVAVLVGGLPPSAGRAFRSYSNVRTIESLANLFLDDRRLLFAPRRRHLHPLHEARLGGSTSAFEYLDARLELLRRGHLTDVVGTETPFVLNAFVESHDRSPSVTNPGLIRLRESGFDITQSQFDPPDAADCAVLLDRCVDVANRAPAPAIVRAAWLCAALLAVHPFVDGNGRTARALFQLVSSSGEAGFDRATIEQWAIDRVSYVEALKASQAPSMPKYDGARVDTSPFVDYALRSSLVGLDLVERRVDWFERAWTELGASSDDECMIESTVVTAGSASITELSHLVEDPVCTQTVERLVDGGRLRWDSRGLLRAGPSSVLPSIGA